MPLHQIQEGRWMNYEVRSGLAPENILFIHGNLASNRWWYPSEEIWRKESQGSDWKGSLIYGEFRGCGNSSAPVHEDEVCMRTFAEDYISLIRELNLEKVHLVGHSTGGLIAALMMARAPELFGKAVLLDPVGTRGVKFDENMISAFEKMKADRNLTAIVIGSTIRGYDPESDYFQKVLVEDAHKSVKSVGHWVLKALDGLDVREELRKVANSVLILHGEHDQLLPMDDSRAYTDLWPQAKFEVIPEQGHCANVENPEAFVRIVKNFLFKS